MNLLSILATVAVIGASALVLEGVNLASGGEFYLASIRHLAQEAAHSATMSVEEHPAPAPSPQPTQPMEKQQPDQPIILPVIPPQEGQPIPRPPEGEKQPMPQPPFEGDNGEDRQEFIDPREIRDGLRNMNDFRREVKRTIKEIKKQASPADLAELNNVLAEVDKLYSIAANSSNQSDARDAVREFHENQYWDTINKVRARLQIPKELKQITQSIRRLEKIIQTKAIKNIGLDLDKVGQTIAEMKQAADKVQGLYNSSNYEEAQEEMQFFHEGGHPGEIEGTIFRLRDIKNMAKRIKDETVRAEIDGVLQEVIDAFNAGEYREARETLDEYADDLQRLISQFVRRRGYRQQDSTRIRNLQDLIIRKLQEANSRPQEQSAAPAQ